MCNTIAGQFVFCSAAQGSSAAAPLLRVGTVLSVPILFPCPGIRSTAEQGRQPLQCMQFKDFPLKKTSSESSGVMTCCPNQVKAASTSSCSQQKEWGDGGILGSTVAVLLSHTLSPAWCVACSCVGQRVGLKASGTAAMLGSCWYSLVCFVASSRLDEGREKRVFGFEVGSGGSWHKSVAFHSLDTWHQVHFGTDQHTCRGMLN